MSTCTSVVPTERESSDTQLLVVQRQSGSVWLPARSGSESLTGRTAELLAGAGGGGAAKVLAVIITVGAATGGMAVSEPPAEGSRLPELRQRPPAADAKRGSAELAER